MKQFLFISMLLAFSLTLISGCASMTGETAGEKIDDSRIVTQANAIIVKDPDAQYFKIDVDSHQGDVVLNGFVNSKDTENRLVDKIKGIRGVKSVKSLVKLEQKK